MATPDHAYFQFCTQCRKTGTIVCTDGTKVITNSKAAAKDTAQKLLDTGRINAVELPSLHREIDASGLPPHAIHDVAYLVDTTTTPGKVIIRPFGDDSFPRDEMIVDAGEQPTRH